MKKASKPTLEISSWQRGSFSHFGVPGLPLSAISGYAIALPIALEHYMPYLIAIILLGVVFGVILFLKRNKVTKPTPNHQGSFNPIFPSEYGGNTYALDQQPGVIFFCTEGALKGQEFPLAVEGIIGNDPQAKISLPNEAISAKLSQEGGQYTLRGLNGKSFIHNEKNTPEAKLSSGDTLIFGKITMKVQVNS
jgi:hypothetical protein